MRAYSLKSLPQMNANLILLLYWNWNIRPYSMRSKNNKMNKRSPMYKLPQQKWLLFFNSYPFFTKTTFSLFSLSIIPFIKGWVSHHRHFLKPYCHIRQDQQNVIKFSPLSSISYESCLLKGPINYINNEKISMLFS